MQLSLSLVMNPNETSYYRAPLCQHRTCTHTQFFSFPSTLAEQHLAPRFSQSKKYKCRHDNTWVQGGPSSK